MTGRRLGARLNLADVWTPELGADKRLARTIINISLRNGIEEIDYCVGDDVASCAGVTFRGWVSKMRATCRTDHTLLEEFRKMEGGITNG